MALTAATSLCPLVSLPAAETNSEGTPAQGGYYWQEADASHNDSQTFFEGRAADVFALAPSWLKVEPSPQDADGKGKSAPVAACVGKFGVIHPQVLKAFDIPFPVSALEINLEPFCYDQTFKVLPTHLDQM